MYVCISRNPISNPIGCNLLIMKRKTTLFLADRTNGRGRAYATMLRPSSVTLCIVAKRCVLIGGDSHTAGAARATP